MATRVIAVSITNYEKDERPWPRFLINGIAVAVLLLMVGATSTFATGKRVDLELVLAIDVSRSIDEREAQLQRQGTADALRNPSVIRAIGGGYFKRIAVAYIDYSSAAYNEVIVNWMVIKDQISAEKFVRSLNEAPLTYGRRTSISDVIEQAVRMIEQNDFQGTRRTIDIAGDGPNNHGRLVNEVRNEAIAKRITINGLPIINQTGGAGAAFWLSDLDKYYQGCVIGGPSAFLVVAHDFDDFAKAVQRKLVFEIAGIRPPTNLIYVNQSTATQAVNSYTYPRGCDIGERLWQRRFQNGFFDDVP